MCWIKDLAEDARQRVGVTDHPTTQDLLRLVEASGARVIHRPVPSPYCVRTERGAVIVLPLQWKGEEDDEDLAHEAGHLLMCPGAGNLLRYLWPDNPRIERLARLHDARDEQYADRFAAAWFRR